MKNNKDRQFHELTKNCEDTARMLKALAHPHRLQLLCHLGDGEKTVGELESLCGASQSVVSQFLGRMKREGLVNSTKEGLFVRYRITDDRVKKTIQALQKIFCPIVLFMLLIFSSGFSRADQTITSIVERIVFNNSALKSAESNIRALESQRNETRALHYPRLSLRTSVVRANNPVYVFGSLLEQQSFGAQNFAIGSLNNPDYLTNIKNSIDLGVPLFTGFEISSGEKIRQYLASQAREQMSLSNQEVQFQALDAALQLLLKKKLYDMLDHRIKASTKEVDDARKLNAKGMVLGSDFYAAQAILSSFNAQKIMARSEASSAEDRLKILLKSSDSITLKGELISKPYPDLNFEKLFSQALLTRGDLKQAELNIEIAKENLNQSRREFLPKVDAFASVETNTKDFDSNPTNQMIGVRSNFPIGNPTYSAHKESAKNFVSASILQKSNLEDSIRVNLSQAINQYGACLESAPLIEQSVLESKKSLELFLPLYREGRQSILDVLRAEEGLIKAQSAQLNNIYQLHISYARVLLNSGQLDSNSIASIETHLEVQP